MYNPASFSEDRIEVLHAFMREHPLATLVTCGASGPEASHVPVVLHSDVGASGSLRCHFARANEHWKGIQCSNTVLAIFQGAHHYITPSWYPSTEEHGKVVPTWDYVVVHVRGHARLFEGEDLIKHLQELTGAHEQAFEKPWSVDDAPGGYIAAMSKAIVGIEIAIDSIEGKWKASQNRLEKDQQGVVEGLRTLDTAASLEMAQIVKERGLGSGE